MAGPVGYVLHCFPQLSETFIENEIRALRQLGDSVTAVSIYRPSAVLVGPTSVDAKSLRYRPRAPVLAIHFLIWAARRPRATVRNVRRAIAWRSQTMLRGVWSAGWMATQLRGAGVRHVHAHFALDAACAGRAASDLLGLSFTFTLHAHELYMRNRTICQRLAMADVLVTVCEYNVAEIVARCGAIDPEHVVIAYCGVDPDQFALAERPDVRQVTLLSVGRLVGQKGFDDLIRAVAILTERGADVRCDIIGDGPLRPALEALVSTLGLEDRVRLLGPLPPPDVALALADCDIFVLACKIDEDGNRDSMPVVIKEAMASGLPVVGTDEVAIPEMIDAEVGRLARPGDPASLADALEEVVTMGADGRRALGLAGRRRVEERFNLLTETAKLQALFNRLMAAAHSAPASPARRP